MASKEGYAKTQEFVVKAIKEGAHTKLSGNQRNAIGIYFGARESTINDIVSSTLFAVREGEKVQVSILRSSDIQKGDILKHPTRNAAGSKKNDAIRRLWRESSRKLKKQHPYNSLQTEKPLPIKVRIQKLKTRDSSTYHLYAGLQSGKSISQIEEELGKQITLREIRIVKSWGISAELPIRKKYDVIIDNLNSTNDKKELRKYFRRDVSWYFLFNQITRSDNPQFITISSMAEKLFRVHTLIKGTRLRQLQKYLYNECDIPTVIRHSPPREGKKPNNINAMLIRQLAQINDEQKDEIRHILFGNLQKTKQPKEIVTDLREREYIIRPSPRKFYVG